MGKGWVNPLRSFLNQVESVVAGIPTQPDFQRSPERYLESFAAIMQVRRMLFDIIDRIDTLAAALDRLRRLHFQYRTASKKIDCLVREVREKHPENTCVGILDRLMKSRDRFAREARALVTYLYYEIATIARILQELFDDRLPDGSEIEYLVGVRNKLLTHPRFDGFTKNSTSTMVLGPILHPHIVGGDAWFPLERDYLRSKLAGLGVVFTDSEGREANVRLLSSKRKTQGFKPTEVLQLQCFDISEPELLGAVAELVEILGQRFMTRLEIACKKKFQVSPDDQ